ncbi:Hypothetical protein PHPALM_17013 [Phytophthora palmivora]|uniref:Polyprotein n=1 Tax=Phytophthora palmivora TaxID=4796 RepID=A0A2P4XNB8_9STRA|nr:Hypothetical protein PHPALM_17013 [Phytophthora palmivora]
MPTAPTRDVRLEGTPISWLSRKHHTVVLSTTEAEYIALCHCMQEMIFLKLLLKELGFATTQPNLIHEDNQSCIKICYNPKPHGRSKHIHVRYCFVQEKSSDTSYPSRTAIPNIWLLISLL